MSWAEELYNVYETQCSDSKMLKVAHSTANSQIEVTITEDGDFVTARALSKEEGKNTVIPVTESSGGRTSGIAPMPFADKLKYIAGDYQEFTSENNSDYYSQYIEQLERWKNSEFSHPAVIALYNYLSKKSIITDLIQVGGILEKNDLGLLSKDFKIAERFQKDAFVRFIVLYQDNERITKTWLDNTLSECFIQFNKGLFKTLGLCYATGKESALTENHPSKIRNTGDQAKIFSANDENGYTYRGRFFNKSETVSVGYEFSQKMHNALKWLIECGHGKSYGSMMTVIWSSAMQPLPDLSSTPIDDLFGDEEEPSENPPDTMPAYKELLSSIILGYKKDVPIHSKVMILGLDAATTGRMSVSLYSELQSSDFFENVMKWHSDTAVLRYSGKLIRSCYNSFSIYEIINCAFGTESGKGYLECKPEVLSDTILRIMPCIVERKPFPQDIMWALYHKASNPLAFEQSYNHRLTLETACGMIYKFYKDHPNYRKGEISMAYDPNEQDRSYLYGCLLAVADAAEREAYDNDKDKAERVTNARRYWNAFSKRPYVTWQRIEEQLLPYLNKLGGKRVRYEKMLQEIKAKFTPESFADNKALEPLYLLGFHHYTTEIFTSKKKEEN